METIVAALADQHAELASILVDLDEDQWRLPSPLEGWTIADVVLHLAQTDEFAIESATGRLPGPAGSPSAPAVVLDVDEAAGRMVAAERGQKGAAVLERWQAGSAGVRAALLACDPHERLIWVAGDLSARTLATTRLSECWIHTGDVAGGLGRGLEPTDRLWHIARLAWQTLPYAFARAGRSPLSGPVAFELTSPAGEPWTFQHDEPATTTIRGDALELCLVAGQRLDAGATALRSEGPDGPAVLELVRTFA